MSYEPYSPQDQSNPVTRAQTRRQVWLQVYLPMGIGILLLAVLVFLLWRGGTATASAWADSALALMILPFLLLGLLMLAFFVVLAVGVGRLIGIIPLPARRAQDVMKNAAAMIRKGGDQAVRPMLVIQAVGGAIQETIRLLSSYLRR